MSEELRDETPEDKIEQSPKEILDALELAFNEGRRAELTVLESNGELRAGTVFIEGFEDDALYISESKDSPVFPIEINRIKKVEVINEPAPEQMQELEQNVDKAREEENGNPEKIGQLKEELEGQFEKTPTKEEIFAIAGVDAEKCSIVKEKLDENGLYYLEFKTEGKEEGETVEFMYTRKGEFDTHKAAGTSIYETHYDKDGGFITYPEHIAEYNADIGEWENVK